MSSKKEALKLKRLTIHELEAANSSFVWVLNNTNPKGNINLTVADGRGRPVNVRVPISWIPIDLTTQSTKNALLEDPNFRTLVAKRLILLIDSAEAIEFLKHGDAAEEHARIYQVGDIAPVGAADENQELEAVKAEAAGDINPFVLNLMVEKTLPEENVLRELRNREDEFTKADYQYIAQNSLHDKVKAWAAEQAL